MLRTCSRGQLPICALARSTPAPELEVWAAPVKSRGKETLPVPRLAGATVGSTPVCSWREHFAQGPWTTVHTYQGRTGRGVLGSGSQRGLGVTRWSDSHMDNCWEVLKGTNCPRRSSQNASRGCLLRRMRLFTRTVPRGGSWGVLMDGSPVSGTAPCPPTPCTCWACGPSICSDAPFPGDTYSTWPSSSPGMQTALCWR